MAPLGAKLCQHAFQTIPDIWFFDAPKISLMKISDRKWSIESKILTFWKNYEFLRVMGRFSRKNHFISPDLQVTTFLGEGVQRRVSIFSLTFGPKPTYTFSSRMMIWCNDDMMIWWDDDMRIRQNKNLNKLLIENIMVGQQNIALGGSVYLGFRKNMRR